MTLIPSQMIPLGTLAPDFSLPDTVSDEEIAFTDIAGKKATVIMFICNHCPYVQHIATDLVKVANEYRSQNIGFVGISANDANDFPEDGPEKMKEYANNLQFPFPYLYDASQQTAKAYGASCTPDLYIFDANKKLVYHGQFDDARIGNGKPVTGKDFRTTLDLLLKEKPVPQKQIPSIGCSIKWKQ